MTKRHPMRIDTAIKVQGILQYMVLENIFQYLIIKTIYL